MRRITIWLQGSIYRVIVLALIAVSVIPIVIISTLFMRQSMEALTQQMEENLQLLAQSKAEEINQKLTEVMHSTIVAAQLASVALQDPLAVDEVSGRLTRYQPDQRQIIGLDHYYQAQGGAAALGESLSNVYWPGPLHTTDRVAQEIIQTESLDTVFQAIKSVSPDTQWVYLTTPEGMMRLYPWASNDHYPDDWDPREIIFYTVAEPTNNPSLEPRWTPPYVDYAGAGWMVTASVPVVGPAGDFLGIMSHDFTIESIKQIALGINVLDGVGYGFLIDSQARVIAHPAFQDADASKGTQEEAILLNQGAPEYRSLIQSMIGGRTGLGYYEEASGASLLVYAPVPATGWSLGISIPRENVIAPATEMRNRAIAITAALVAVCVALAVHISQRIHRPIVQLLQGVQQVSAEQKADEIQIKSFDEFRRLAQAFNEMAAKVWERETHLKKKMAEMKIEIDAQKRSRQVESIVETDFFKRLEANANQLRARVKNQPQAQATD